MENEHIGRRRQAESVAARDVLIRLIDVAAIDEVDREILRMRYLGKKQFGYIADITGYSTRQIVRRHKAALAKLAMLMNQK